VNAFQEAGLPAVVTTVVTQIVVDENDPAFDAPTKPVGEMIATDKVLELQARGWKLVEDDHRGGWRRVVASPDPREIVEAGAIRALVDDGVVVIAAGGGGIPVAPGPDGGLRGVPAVVDKDLATALLASDLSAQCLLVLTDVDHVFTGYKTPEQWPLRSIDVGGARALLARGEFGAGSMGPKVEAVCRFVEATGETGIITSIERCKDALEEGAGTHIVS
jgi:carbamate kinase